MKNSYTIKLVVATIVFLVLQVQSALALGVKDFTFTSLGIADGLSSQRVYSLLATEDGAVWWTTKQGVDRTNGTQITNYNIKNSSLYSSLAGRVVKFVHTLDHAPVKTPYVFDNTGRIFMYDEVQDCFVQTVNVSELLCMDIVLNDVVIIGETLYIAMREGAYVVQRNEIKPILKGKNTFYIEPISPSSILFCTDQGGFLHKNGKQTLFAPYNCRSAYYDAKTGNVWLGTYNEGVKIVSLKNGNQLVANLSTSIPHNPIRSITAYDNDIMLIGIDGFGVFQAPRRKLRDASASLLFNANDSSEGVLSGNGIYAILVDAWQNIVVGSYSGGIDVARPVGSTTAIYRHEKNNSQSLINDHVNCVRQLNDGTLLIGTDDGISHLDRAAGTYWHAARGMVVLDICPIPGKTLLATYGNGVCEIDPQGHTRQLYSTANGTLKDDHVYSLHYDRKGNLWIGTLFGSLSVSTPSGLIYYPIDNVLDIVELSNGSMAIGTAHGLYLINPETNKTTELNFSVPGCQEANHYVQNIQETDDHKLWIATDGGGVYIYDLAKEKATMQLTTDDGLPSNSVSSITIGTDGRFWLGTEEGLAFTRPDKPNEIVNVNYCYGLETEYIRGASVVLKDGNILFGTVNAAIIINPKNVNKLNYETRLTIKGVKIRKNENGNRTNSESDIKLLNRQIAKGIANGEIRMKYSQRSFDILMECINLRNAFDIAFQHKTGNSEWSQPTTQPYINFVNLEPGTHTLYIRCISRTSNTVLDEIAITLKIGQPWWNTWWMWVVYVSLLILAFYVAWQIYNLHSRYMRLVLENVRNNGYDNGNGYDNVNGNDNGYNNVNGNDNGYDNLNGNDNGNDYVNGNWDEKEYEDKDRDEDNDDDTGEVDDEGGSDYNEDGRGSEKEKSAFVSRATQIVLDNLKNTEFTIDHLCREMAMSRTHFYVKLKTYTGKSPLDFMRVIRLERAATLLRQGHSVTEVSELVGFDNPKYFSTVFKKYFDISPSKFK